MTDARRLSLLALLGLLLVVNLTAGGGGGVASKVTQVTYVYEKDASFIPSGVQAALNRLNRERGILATSFERDTTDGSGEVPEQYKPAAESCEKFGLPLLVVQSGQKVLQVVKSPTTETSVMEAAR